MPQWVSLGGGHLAIGHRPQIKAIRAMPQDGCTHVLTLLSEAEGAAAIGAAVQAAGIRWFWFPLSSAVPPPASRLSEVCLLYQNLQTALEAQARIFIHCSAGIHRTGMVAYGFLRSQGLSPPEAVAKLQELREVTGERVGVDRLAWGDQFGVQARA